jgi:hypothetical protein
MYFSFATLTIHFAIFTALSVANLSEKGSRISNGSYLSKVKVTKKKKKSSVVKPQKTLK